MDTYIVCWCRFPCDCMGLQCSVTVIILLLIASSSFVTTTADVLSLLHTVYLGEEMKQFSRVAFIPQTTFPGRICCAGSCHSSNTLSPFPSGFRLQAGLFINVEYYVNMLFCIVIICLSAPWRYGINQS